VGVHPLTGRPLPLITIDNEFFWTSGADGKLRLQECGDCTALIHPPAPVCRYCRSHNLSVRAVSGRATLAGFTVNHRFSLPGLPAPYVVAQVAIAEDCPNVGVPRPTGIAIDPTNDRNVWVGLEVDGVRFSRDGGETWAKVNGQIPNQDVHNMLVVEGPPKTVFTVVNDDIWRSTDDGKTWQAARAREVFPWHYPRGIAVKPGDPRTVFLTLGDSTPGRIGTVVRTRDAGVTWEALKFPVQPNSAIWTVAIADSAPDTMFAASRYGYLYRSDDGGDAWRKLWREFGEVSSIQWVPR